jgi:hypothetical protein
MLKVFSVYDSKVGAYLQPMFFRSKGEAIRAFSSAVADTDHQFHKYASDFTLFELGSWDDLKAKFDLLPTPVSIGVAIEFLNTTDDSNVPVPQVSAVN